MATSNDERPAASYRQARPSTTGAPADDVVVGGRYRLGRRLGRGGMSDVYLATDEVLNRQVAIKIMYAQYAAEERFVVRFRREATAVAKLNHPNIVAVYDWGPHEDTYFIAMELVEGESLSQLLATEGRLPVADAVTIAGAVARALGSAHQGGIVHRDIKPDNVLIANDGEIKVTDFGIARAFEGDADLTATGQVMGTASYFSPEQATGGSVGPRGDLYSLGILLFEMVTGDRPFTGNSPVSIAYKHIHDQPPAPSSLAPSVPPELDGIVLSLLAKSPEDRYSSALELEQDLVHLANGDLQAIRRRSPQATERTAGIPAAEHTGRTAVMPQPGAWPGERSDADSYQDLDDHGYYETPNRSGVFILGLAVAMVAVIAGVVLLAGRIIQTADSGVETIEVPDLVGTTEAAASNRLTDLDLAVQVVFEESTAAEPGTVISQQPAAGTEVEPKSVVTIVVVVSDEAIEMLSVVGADVNDAVADLTALGFKVNLSRQESDTVEIDRVISQSIQPGQLANSGATVTLIVSAGGATEAVIPPLAGRTGEQATLQLGQLGFTDVTVQREQSSTVAEGIVIRVNPASGSTVDLTQRITVVVSSGSPDASSTSGAPSTSAPPATTAAPTTTPTQPPSTTTTTQPTTTASTQATTTPSSASTTAGG